MANKTPFSSYVYNPEYVRLGFNETFRVDPRLKGDLLDDRMVKWFAGVACTGAIIDESYLLKDLERIVLDGKTFDAFVAQDIEVGEKIEVTFEHVETLFTYKVRFTATKTRDESSMKPVILDFEEAVVDKEKATVR